MLFNAAIVDADKLVTAVVTLDDEIQADPKRAWPVPEGCEAVPVTEPLPVVGAKQLPDGSFEAPPGPDIELPPGGGAQVPEGPTVEERLAALEAAVLDHETRIAAVEAKV